MRSQLLAGSLVQVRGERWRLTRVEPFGRATVLTLEGREAANAGRRLRLIAPFDRPVAIGTRRLPRRSRQSVMRAALAAIAAARPALGLWTAAAARIDVLAYQLEPALAVLRGATRLLLADAVGLGKTIQAGLILAELRERGWLDRALVVCPAGLRDTWAAELGERFAIDCAVLDQAAIAEAVSALPAGVNPWASHPVTVASIDFVKRPEVLAAVTAAPIDLLIVDEAHHLTPGTDRGAAINRIAARTPWCVFVSATPHSGDQAAFDYLCGLGAHGTPIAIFRRSRDETGLTAARRTQTLAVRPHEAETALLGSIERYVRAIWRGRGRHDRAVQLVAITIARRGSSSPLAVARTLARRLALIGTTPGAPQTRLPWDEEDAADASGEESLLAVPGLDDAGGERAALEELIALAARCGEGAKIHRLRRLLTRAREPAIVFTEFRDTVEAVATALSPRRIGCIHGGVPVAARRQTIDAFNAGGLDLLIATDTAGEGLNLHHRCRLVVDMELPWNPLRLEQRVGRVDRLGQRRRVHAISLFHAGTVEARVLEQLQRRRQRAGLLGATADADTARAVFDGEVKDAAIDPPPQCRAFAAAADEVRRIAWQRQVGQRGMRPGWAAPRWRRRSRVVALSGVTCTNASGALVEERVEPLLIEVAPPASGKTWRGVIDAIAAACPQASATTAALSRERETLRASVAARLSAIRSLVARESNRRVQPSLFDRRAEAAHAADLAAASGINHALARRHAAVCSPVEAEGTTARLLAAWPLHRR